MTDEHNASVRTVIVDMVIGGVAGLLQAAGMWILLVLALGRFLSSLLSTTGTSDTRPLSFAFFGAIALFLLLSGPILVSLYQGNPFARALLHAVSASLISIPITLVVLILFWIFLRGLSTEMGAANNLILLALPTYVVIVAALVWLLGSRNVELSWYSVTAAVALALVILLIMQPVHFTLLRLGPSDSGDPGAGYHVVLALLYTLLTSTSFPPIARLFSKQYSSVWTVLVPLVLGVLVVTLGIVLLSITTQ
jgi:hypothetical protein